MATGYTASAVGADVVRRAQHRRRSLRSDFLGDAIERLQRKCAVHWPAAKYQAEPVRFAEEVLGVRLWSAQIEIVEAIRDHRRVSVAGGRKIGKDFALAVAALWWYASFPKARVFATATTGKQIEGILYREIRQLFAFSGRCLSCKVEDPDGREACDHSAKLTGSVGLRASTGVKSDDFREILGFTSDKAEGMAGWSGERMLAILDEASGIDDEIHVAIQGNLASENSREVLISNPTQARGFFFDSHHSKKELYHPIQVSSLSTPNVVQGREVFPGLASREWAEARKLDWGEETARYRAHVLGLFTLNEQGAVFPLHMVHAAEQRWEDTDAVGQLTIGVDPAGASGGGDESAFAARRGLKVMSLTTRRGLTAEAHLIEILGLISTLKTTADEVARIVVDRDGEVGAKVWGVLLGYLETHPGAFDLSGVRGGERAHRKPDTYDRWRDELYAVLADWFRSGGAIPEDLKLSGELQAFRWEEHISGRTKAIPKDELRKILGRSTDRADAVALSCWAQSALLVADTNPAVTTAKAAQRTEDERVPALDPYRGGRAFNPYGGRS